MMPEKTVLILEREGGPWQKFLSDYFSDTPAVVRSVSEPAQAAIFFDRAFPKVVFAEPSFLNRSFLQKIIVRRNTDPSFRAYLLGKKSAEIKEHVMDGSFSTVSVMSDFSKCFTDSLPLRESICLLVVDDESEIGAMVRDYLEGRRDPAFEIECASNGQDALAAIARQRPDVILLDIKMPVMDGREFYAQLRKQDPDIPVIVFFDSISSEELAEIRKCGNPAVVEKGHPGSSLPSLLTLIKKLVYFCSIS